MSAAKAKRPSAKKKEPEVKTESPSDTKRKIEESSFHEPIKVQHDLVIDGKVVKASYNSGIKERFVHVTEIKVDEKDNRSNNSCCVHIEISLG